MALDRDTDAKAGLVATPDPRLSALQKDFSWHGTGGLDVESRRCRHSANFLVVVAVT